MNIKKGQKIIVIAGDEKGKSGKVIRVSKDKNFIWVEGLNIVTKHVKPQPNFGIKGGIVKIEAKIHHSNVSVIENKEGVKLDKSKTEKPEVEKETKAKKVSSTKKVEKQEK